MAKDVIKMKDLSADQVPEQLKVSYYFDFKEHPFRHHDLFEGKGITSIVAVLGAIEGYARDWITKAIAAKKKDAKLTTLTAKDLAGRSSGMFTVLVEEGATFEPAFVQGGPGKDKAFTLLVSKGCRVTGCNIFLDEGDIYIGENTIVEPAAGVKGPTIIGNNDEVRSGAYFRGSVILGDNGVFRGELKNTVLMDKANFPHPSYLGDSICGFMTHFGNQATTANLGIYADVTGRNNIVMKIDGKSYDLGRPKMGIIMGTNTQVGCNTVSDPGTFLGPFTVVYQLSRLNKGFYGPREVLKNKPLEHGVIERSPLDK